MSQPEEFRDFVLNHEFDQLAKGQDGRAVICLEEDEYQAMQSIMAEAASPGSLNAALELLADIRAAAGDPDGKMTQTELVQRIAEIREQAARAQPEPSNGVPEWVRRELRSILDDAENYCWPTTACGACKECGEWNPCRNHPEAHGHREDCEAHVEYERRTHWEARLEALITHPQPAQQGSVPEEVIKAAVDRFLQWKLPEDFCPDGGVSFDRAYDYDSPHFPVGTNILTAEQAEQMLKECLGAATTQPQTDGWIKCSERLPTVEEADEGGRIWVSSPIGAVWLASFHDARKQGEGWHWKPTGLKRPQPPQQGGAE